MGYPDLSERPHSMSVERIVEAPIDVLYQAWTSGMFGEWFAEPGSATMRAEVDAPFFFETTADGKRHPHYGRFLRLDQPNVIEMTWVNAVGTHGEETVVTVELEETEAGTLVRLTHAGFPDEEACERHQEAWPTVLDDLADRAPWLRTDP